MENYEGVGVGKQILFSKFVVFTEALLKIQFSRYVTSRYGYFGGKKIFVHLSSRLISPRMDFLRLLHSQDEGTAID